MACNSLITLSQVLIISSKFHRGNNSFCLIIKTVARLFYWYKQFKKQYRCNYILLTLLHWNNIPPQFSLLCPWVHCFACIMHHNYQIWFSVVVFIKYKLNLSKSVFINNTNSSIYVVFWIQVSFKLSFLKTFHKIISGQYFNFFYCMLAFSSPLRISNEAKERKRIMYQCSIVARTLTVTHSTCKHE